MSSGRTALEEALAFDRAHVWHPYAPANAAGPPDGPPPVRLVERAEGVRLHLAGHGPVIDGMSSWWAAVHGYQHPSLDAAASGQLGRMSHVMFGGLTHEPALDVVRRLLEAAGPRMRHVFLCDSGSVSVEVAVKMCLQYQHGQGHHRRRFLTVRGGYHGDTFAAMSLCDPVNGMHSMFTGALVEQVFAPRPPAGFDRPDDDEQVQAWADAVTELADRHADQLAGIIVEPVLQGAGGMYVYSPACLRVLRALADRYGLLLVLDEIATGFGRTGEYFAAWHAWPPGTPAENATRVAADIVCVGKALTGGYLTMAAVLCTAQVAAVVDAGPGGALMHGPTFMANPLACAVAAANLDLLATGTWRGQVAGIEAGLRAGLGELVGEPGVADVRVLGAVGVVQLDRPVDVPAVTDVLVRHGVWLRPFRDLVYTMPPYLCTPPEIDTITRAIRAAVRAVPAAG